MALQIHHNDGTLIEFNNYKIMGRKVIGGYGFTIALKGFKKQAENITISNISLALAASNTGEMLALPVASDSQIINCLYQRKDELLYFHFLLTKSQVNELEVIRNLNDMDLRLDMRAIIQGPEGLESSYSNYDHQFSVQEWLEALDKNGYRQSILFEIPLPKTNENFDSLISKAQHYIEQGHYKDSVLKCRQIIESIELARNDNNEVKAAKDLNKSTTTKSKLTPKQRMLLMRDNLKQICHLGAHVGEDFTRSQARAVLATTLSLLSEPTVGFDEGLELNEVNQLELN